MLPAAAGSAGAPHVIVVGNEKGGSGKTTIAMHVAVALLKAGQRVATIDLDSRQKSLTRYVETRRPWGRRPGKPLELPTHYAVARAEGIRVDENELSEFAGFEKAVVALQHAQDFVVIDTPPHDSYLMRLAHSIADTLVSPLNDSFIDLDVLTGVDPVTFRVTESSHYAEMVRETRRHRRASDGTEIDWVVVQNRVTRPKSPNNRRVTAALTELAGRVGFRPITGLGERTVYRELFSRGLTAMDGSRAIQPDLDRSRSCTTARLEVETLLQSLQLPIDERGRRRAAARAEWAASRGTPLDTDDILAA